MKATIRRWENTENKNHFVNVDVVASPSGQISVKMDGIVLVDGYFTVEDALAAAEVIIRTRKLSN